MGTTVGAPPPRCGSVWQGRAPPRDRWEGGGGGQGRRRGGRSGSEITARGGRGGHQGGKQLKTKEPVWWLDVGAMCAHRDH